MKVSQGTDSHRPAWFDRLMYASEKLPSQKPGKPGKQTRPLQPALPASPENPTRVPARPEHFAERHDDPAQAEELERQQDA
ncbi:MAG: hypothetical protein ORN29_03735 [Rhodoferax sp.]|nr:hypothetical protein [Rhodoferax sp.]